MDTKNDVTVHVENPTRELPSVVPTKPLVWSNGDGTSSKFVMLEDSEGEGDDSETEYDTKCALELVNTPQLMQEVLEKWRPKIGHCFAKDDDFETFMKLPIPMESRLNILQTAIKASYKPRRTRKRRAQSEITHS